MSAAEHVVVTGGAGFIGSHVVDALIDQGHRVWVVDDLSGGQASRVNPAAELVELNVTDAAGLAQLASSIGTSTRWFHLAAQIDVRISVNEPLVDAHTNVLGTLAVLEAARSHGARVVFSSTGGAIYGEALPPTPESATEQPLSFYGAAKLAAEKYVATHARLYELEHAIVRYANVYGPRQDPHGEGGVVAIFGGKALAGQAPTIFGDGTQTRDYTYVGDVVAATLAASTVQPHPDGAAQEVPVWNVGTGVETTVCELWEAVQQLTDCSAEPVFAPLRPGEVARSALDASLAREQLGLPLNTPIATGLAATLDWMRERSA